MYSSGLLHLSSTKITSRLKLQRRGRQPRISKYFPFASHCSAVCSKDDKIMWYVICLKTKLFDHENVAQYPRMTSSQEPDMEFPYRPKAHLLERIGISKKVREVIVNIWSKLALSKKSLYHSTQKYWNIDLIDISDAKEKDDSSHNRQLKRGQSDSNLERLEDLITDGVCVAGDLELTQETTSKLSNPDTSLSIAVPR